MKKYSQTRISIILGCIAFLTLAFGNNIDAQSPESGNVKTSIAEVNVFATTDPIPFAGASLVRNNDAVFGTISTSGLTPGDAVTLWWVIFNNPSACDTSPCSVADLNNALTNAAALYRGGRVVGIDGRVDFSGYLAEGDNTGAFILAPNMPNPSPGIVDAKTAAIHFVIRTHGQASDDPDTLNLQLTTLTGGCGGSPNPCKNLQSAIFEP